MDAYSCTHACTYKYTCIHMRTHIYMDIYELSRVQADGDFKVTKLWLSLEGHLTSPRRHCLQGCLASDWKWLYKFSEESNHSEPIRAERSKPQSRDRLQKVSSTWREKSLHQKPSQIFGYFSKLLKKTVKSDLAESWRKIRRCFWQSLEFWSCCLCCQMVRLISTFTTFDFLNFKFN